MSLSAGITENQVRLNDELLLFYPSKKAAVWRVINVGYLTWFLPDSYGKYLR